MTIKLITHSGYPHADDVFSYAVLMTIFPDHELIRTRDEDLFNPTDIAVIFDVGYKFDGQTYFDHHQPDKQMRDETIPYSAFGLIWRRFGETYLNKIGITDIEQVHAEVDRRFVRLVDIGDNGVICDDTHKVTTDMSFIRVIADAADSSDEQFVRVAEYAEMWLQKLCLKVQHLERDSAKLEHVTFHTKHIAVFDFEIDSRELLRRLPNYDDLLFVVSKRGENQWQVNTISDQPFVSRKLLHKRALGLTYEQLTASTGIPGLVFCHTAGFIAVGSTKQSVLDLAAMSC